MVSRHNAEGKEQDLGPQQKFNEGDELVLKGKPHVLAMHVAGASHSHAPTLLKPMEVEGMRSSLAGEREALVLAAQELHDRLLPCVRRKQLEWCTVNVFKDNPPPTPHRLRKRPRLPFELPWLVTADVRAQ